MGRRSTRLVAGLLFIVWQCTSLVGGNNLYYVGCCFVLRRVSLGLRIRVTVLSLQKSVLAKLDPKKALFFLEIEYSVYRNIFNDRCE